MVCDDNFYYFAVSICVYMLRLMTIIIEIANIDQTEQLNAFK